ncbi:unnamed protein product [Didymodactylos carnosus]|uniref:Uncharacterized protein n=1 Tax=Didymodactylos carnosus TaxID=1234261 RepID=A0A814CJ24_9BILA|nr:unnamed protein product [Didymodactylos carnosus]CAF1411587.1 unnamed protein product [Didymodactylos carnosus]CAF3717413.1 unnamed protein product [Didymodactylos carnosus]CAF4215256.1 unnamed protein product [Didymodactylos carnosus]
MSKTKKGQSSTPPSLPVMTDPECAARYERELEWCVNQLNYMLMSKSNSKNDQEQKHAAQCTLQTLTNPKTSIIRKRQLMQSQTQIMMNKNCEIPASSRFIRKHQNSGNNITTDDNSEMNHRFTFNFEISSTDKNENFENLIEK